MLKNLSNSPIDLMLAPGERFHARAKLFIAAQFDLIQCFGNVIATGMHITYQGLDTEYRCLQGYELGL